MRRKFNLSVYDSFTPKSLSAILRTFDGLRLLKQCSAFFLNINAAKCKQTQIPFALKFFFNKFGVDSNLAQYILPSVIPAGTALLRRTPVLFTEWGIRNCGRHEYKEKHSFNWNVSFLDLFFGFQLQRSNWEFCFNVF